ncbi:hypothetical protein UCD39_03260 [Nitrospirillum sp. BR 11752]|uniref:hypothetical protein n=1 Tax=Nitrospirillum sp. BR 11752 TaxID=3104293 RepID=UPI002EAB0680|nr:hypothetical protein [Nitrospirillum sp. BR 11752]
MYAIGARCVCVVASMAILGGCVRYSAPDIMSINAATSVFPALKKPDDVSELARKYAFVYASRADDAAVSVSIIDYGVIGAAGVAAGGALFKSHSDLLKGAGLAGGMLAAFDTQLDPKDNAALNADAAAAMVCVAELADEVTTMYKDVDGTDNDEFETLKSAFAQRSGDSGLSDAVSLPRVSVYSLINVMMEINKAYTEQALSHRVRPDFKSISDGIKQSSEGVSAAVVNSSSAINGLMLTRANGFTGVIEEDQNYDIANFVKFAAEFRSRIKVCKSIMGLQ